MTQQSADKTVKMFLQTEEEVFTALVGENHPFRILNQLINFSELVEPFMSSYSKLGCEGIAIEQEFKVLLVQFWEATEADWGKEVSGSVQQSEYDTGETWIIWECIYVHRRVINHYEDSIVGRKGSSDNREGEEKLNNANVKEYTADKEARFGAKYRGKRKVLFQCLFEAMCLRPGT